MNTFGEIELFASGMSRPLDILGAVHAKQDFGVVAGELADCSIAAIAEVFVIDQRSVFIDSGAYGLFSKKKRAVKELMKDQGLFGGVDEKTAWEIVNKSIQPIDFRKVMCVYRQVVSAIEQRGEVGDRLKLVMPDVIGDQVESMRLITEFKAEILEFIKKGIDVIIPLQKGDLSLVECYLALKEQFGYWTLFRAGLPTKEAVVSAEEFYDFLWNAEPGRIHFLGAATPTTLADRLWVIQKVWGDEEDEFRPHFTADANVLMGERSEYLDAKDQGATREEAVALALLKRRFKNAMRAIADEKDIDAVKAMTPEEVEAIIMGLVRNDAMMTVEEEETMLEIEFKRGQEVETVYQCLSSAAGSRSKVVKTRKDKTGSTWVRCNFGKNQGGQFLLKWMPADALKLVQEAA